MVAKGSKLLEEMRLTQAGWKQSDFFPVLEYHGYEFVRHVRHGAMYRHPELAKHPDRDVRMKLAQVIVPKGNPVKEYVAELVLESVDFLLAYQKEREHA
jgi:hypothetical protein